MTRLPSHLRAAIVILMSLTLITGLIYPLAVTGVAQVPFPRQADGSIITRNGQTAGSALIGQSSDDPGYFRTELGVGYRLRSDE